MLTRHGSHFAPRRRHLWALALVLVVGLAGGAAAVASSRRSDDQPQRVTTPKVTTTTTSTVPVLAPVDDGTTTSAVDADPPTLVGRETNRAGSATTRPKPSTTGTPSTRRPTQAGTSTPTEPPRPTTTADPYWPWGCYPFCDQLND